MIISFVGSPCSGKTTTAAMTFAHLKDIGVPAEFIPEQARLYIATLRSAVGLFPEDSLQLSQNDQLQILRKQYDMETIMMVSCGPGVVLVTDSSVLNTLLYMDEDTRQLPDVQELVKDAVERYDRIFYCGPVKRPWGLDPNRIHSEAQSLQIDRQIPDLLERFAPGKKLEVLFGDSKTRYVEVVQKVQDGLS